MKCYLTREQALNACQELSNFYIGLKEYYAANGLDVESNRGRRNILMSEPMEKFIADELSKSFRKVISDGRTGKADIIIEHDDREIEIECKLTSPHESSGSIAFQTDYQTLRRKGSLDYIYIVANPDFDGFCCIYFSQLTADDFRGLSPGARGKVQMYKHRGMKKATVLVGNVVDRKIRQINKLEAEKLRLGMLKSDIDKHLKSYKDVISKKIIDDMSSNKNMAALINKKYIESQKYDEKLYKLEHKIIMKNMENSSYSIEYEVIKNETTSDID